MARCDHCDAELSELAAPSRTCTACWWKHGLWKQERKKPMGRTWRTTKVSSRRTQRNRGKKMQVPGRSKRAKVKARLVVDNDKLARIQQRSRDKRRQAARAKR